MEELLSFYQLSTIDVNTSVSCGYNYTAVLKNGKLYTFGNNCKGQLGTGDKRNRLSPALIPFLESIMSVSVGHSHTVILTTSGEVYTFGCNSEGQLGTGDKIGRLTPTLIPFSEAVKCISAGIYHTAVITKSGLLYTFGNNG